MRNRRFAGWLFLTILALFSTSCGGAVDQTVTFYRNEAWEAEVKLSLPLELLALGGVAELERQVEDQARQWQAQGVRVSWKATQDRSSQVYTYRLRGQGLHLLNDVLFDGNALIYVTETGGQRQIYFSRQITRGLFDDLSRYTLKLNGREVVAGNGRQINRASMEWVNPSGNIEAVIVEKNRLNLSALLVPGIILAVVGGGWLLFRRRAGPCAHCGQWLAAGARFCPACGQSRSGKASAQDSWSSNTDPYNWN